MDPHAMGLQGGMSVPMSMGMAMPSASAGNPQPMGMNMGGMAPYQQQMMMNMNPMGQMGQMQSMGMQMNPSGMNAATASAGMQPSVPSADWRIQVTREHRANLIAKIYNEMVRVSADPVPGIKLWMNVSWYELSLYKESPTQEVYINKIFTRLKSLRAQQSDMNAAMAAQALPNQGMLSRLDFSYYNTLNLNQRSSGQVGGYPGHSQFSGPGPHPGAQQQQKAMSAGAPQVKAEAGVPSNVVAEYWRQHATLKAKHQADVEKVHIAFKKYVDHMKSHDETEQKKKLRYLLSYVELCSNILAEDKTTHPPRKIEELDKVFKYIVKIVNPYLKKLRTETNKRSGDSTGSSDSHPSGSTSSSPAPTSGPPTSSGTSAMPANTSNGFSSATAQPQTSGQAPQQNPGNASAQNQQSAMHQTPQQKQQQFMMQQRAQQLQQQQRMQAQAARQQQILQQQQQMMQQQQIQQKQIQQKDPQSAQQQAQFSAQQANQMKQQQQQQNSQNAANQQGGQQTQQQMSQQAPSRPQQSSQAPQSSVQQQKPQQNQPVPTSRGESPSMSSGLSLGLDDSLYGGMSNSDLLQMPTPSGSNSGYMDFSSALSPTSFGGMDLLDWDDGAGTSGQPGSGQGNSNAAGGEDLMSFVETL